MAEPVFPDRAGFRRAAAKAPVVPVYRELVIDTETPVAAFARVGREDSFLLESVVGGAKWGAYSFIGVAPRARLEVGKGRARLVTYDVEGEGAPRYSEEAARDGLEALDRLLEKYRAEPPEGADLPRFFGGAVGFLSYDAVRTWEPIGDRAVDDLDLPEAAFVITDTVIIFDNLRQRARVVANAFHEGGVDKSYDRACERIDALCEALRGPTPRLHAIDLGAPALPRPASATSRPRFLASVRRIQEHILAGDAFQVVLSQRFEAERVGLDPFDLYRALRALNPSPYMYHLHLPGVIITGASPETLVRLEGRRIELRPIAGTRPRGRDPIEDERLGQDLLADEKENAEHVMLIDLGRNDVGRVATVGSVRVEEARIVERYSHVMHLVSSVSGELRVDKRPLDVLRAAFPAGTLTGAPKVRAMQIVDELEPVRRGIYGGAVGYVSFPVGDVTNLDFAIAIRTLVTVGERVFIQAGAGIVHDSVPATEYEETIAKARAPTRALEIARHATRASTGGRA